MNYQQLVDERRGELNRHITEKVLSFEWKGNHWENPDGVKRLQLPDYFSNDGAELVRQKVAKWASKGQSNIGARLSEILAQQKGVSVMEFYHIEPWMISLAAALATGFSVGDGK